MPLADYGIDSVAAIGICGEIEDTPSAVGLPHDRLRLPDGPRDQSASRRTPRRRYRSGVMTERERSRSSASTAASPVPATPKEFWRAPDGGPGRTPGVPEQRSDATVHMAPPTVPPTPSPAARPQQHRARRLPRRSGRLRPPFFGIPPARRARWTRSSGCCSSAPGGPSRTPECPDPARGPARCGIFVGSCPTTGRGSAAAPRRDHPAHRHRQRPLHARQPRLLPARSAGPQPRGGHRVLLVPRRRASRRAAALRAGRVRLALAGGRQLILTARCIDDLLRPGRARPRPTAGASPSPPRPTASAAARASRCWCCAGSSDALADGDRRLRGDPRQRRQPGRRAATASRPPTARPSAR